MKKDVVITIKGIQYYEDDRNAIELTTIGRFYNKNGIYYLTYEESEATGFSGSRTSLKIEGGRITMLRSGANRSQLIVEEGRRHQCQYETGYGPLTLGVSGDRVQNNLTDEGGEVNFRYTLDINASTTSENEVFVTVREKSPARPKETAMV